MMKIKKAILNIQETFSGLTNNVETIEKIVLTVYLGPFFSAY